MLWQIAATVGIANGMHDDVCLPSWDYESFFSVPSHVFCDEPYGTEAHETDAVEHIDPRVRIYLQDYGLWAHCEALISEWFQPSDSAREILAEKIDTTGLSAIPENQRLAVHVRRGDILTIDPNVYPVCSPDYYRNATQSFDSDLVPCIFSDDQSWCRENMPEILQKDCIFIEGGPPRPPFPEGVHVPALDWVDMFLQAECTRHIMANSTYSWWAAYVSGDGRPRYPATWFGPENSYIDVGLMFPSGWVRI